MGSVGTMVQIDFGALRLGADDDTLAAGGLGLILGNVLVLGGAVGVVGVSTAGTTAVEKDAVASAGDAVAFAGAAAGAGADAGWGGAVGRAGGQGWNIGLVVRVIEVGLGVGIDGLARELAGQSLKRGLVVLGVDDLAGLVGTLWLGSNDPGGRERTALGDRGAADAARVAGGALGLGGRGLGLGGDVEDVQLAAGGGLGGGLAGGDVGDVVAVNDVVVPVALSLLEGSTLELEAANPAAALLGVLGERELSGVVVP